MNVAKNYPLNCGTATGPFSRVFAKQRISERSVDIGLVSVPRQSTVGATTNVTLGDANLTRTVYPTTVTDYRVNLEYLPTKFTPPKSFTSTDPSVVKQSQTDPFLFEYQNNGSFSIITELINGETIIDQERTTSETENTVDTFNSFIDGSLSNYLDQHITSYANNTTEAPQHFRIYETFDQTNKIFTKNTECWAADLDFSGLMVGKAAGGSGGVTMVSVITPYHAIGAKHYPPAVGDVIYFCDRNNVTVERTVESIRILDDSSLDCVVIKFSEALPDTVAKYKTLPSNYRNYLPVNVNTYSGSAVASQQRAGYLPIVGTSHYNWTQEWPFQRSNRYAYIFQTTAAFVINYNNAERIIMAGAFPWRSWSGYIPTGTYLNSGLLGNSPVRGGDSGGPAFFVIQGELVLVQCYQSAISGPFHPSFLSEIQSAIDELGPSGQIYETVNLSEFTNFSS